MNKRNILIVAAIVFLLYLISKKNKKYTRSKNYTETLPWVVPNYADLNVAPYSGFNYDVRFKYYWDHPNKIKNIL